METEKVIEAMRGRFNGWDGDRVDCNYSELRSWLDDLEESLEKKENYRRELTSASLTMADQLNKYADVLAKKNGEIKRLKDLLSPLLDIDFSKCSPLPWRSEAKNEPIADTGDVEGYTYLRDAKGAMLIAASEDTSFRRLGIGHEVLDDEPVYVEGDDGWCHDANIYTIAKVMNAVKEVQEKCKNMEKAYGT